MLSSLYLILVLKLAPVGLGLTHFSSVTHALGKFSDSRAVQIDSSAGLTYMSKEAPSHSSTDPWPDVQCKKKDIKKHGEKLRCAEVPKHSIGTHLSGFCKKLTAKLERNGKWDNITDGDPSDFSEGMQQSTWPNGTVVLTNSQILGRLSPSDAFTCFEPNLCKRNDKKVRFCYGGNAARNTEAGICRCLHTLLRLCTGPRCLQKKICKCPTACPHFKEAFGCKLSKKGASFNSVGEAASLASRSDRVHEGTPDGTVQNSLMRTLSGEALEVNLNASTKGSSTLDDSLADKCTG